MKCEHEGCVVEGVGRACVDLDYASVPEEGCASTEASEFSCPAHLTAWLREKADEVEGVKECVTCDGHGLRLEPTSRNCKECHGAGRVKR
jgi:hypothetical protein